ncbi:MAG: pentapeptide repeat-containing protein [Deltaproteobacteria bacterium]
MYKTLYDFLEVSHKASPEIIKNAYRVLALKYHPDNLDTGNEEMFKKIAKAYEILSDNKSRQDYDTRLLHNKEDLFVNLSDDTSTSEAPQTVKRLDGSDTWCTIDEHIKRKGAELSDTNLKGLLLRHLSLAGGNLNGADLSNAFIENLDFTGTDFTSVVCENATFSNTTLSEAKLDKARFKNCVFKDCKFIKCAIKNVDFLSCDFRGSIFTNANLNQVNFSNSILEGVAFSGRGWHSYTIEEIKSIKFNGCNLRGLNRVDGNGQNETKGQDEYGFAKRKYTNVDFSEANMEGANFSGSIFDKCNFLKASLVSANFSGSEIIAPESFEDASLFGVDFSDTIIKNADFATCNIVNARFHGSYREGVLFPKGFVAPSNNSEKKINESDNVEWLIFGTVIFILATIIILSVAFNQP